MANQKIESKISLDTAMSVTRGMTPQQVSDQWIAWGSAFPAEKAKLNAAIVAALDLMATMVTIEKNLLLVITTIETVVVNANKAYKIGLSLLPGIGAVDGAKTAAETAMALAKDQIATAVGKISQLPVTLYNQLTNIKIDEGAKI